MNVGLLEKRDEDVDSVDLEENKETQAPLGVYLFRPTIQ